MPLNQQILQVKPTNSTPKYLSDVSISAPAYTTVSLTPPPQANYALIQPQNGDNPLDNTAGCIIHASISNLGSGIVIQASNVFEINVDNTSLSGITIQSIGSTDFINVFYFEV